MAVGYTAPARVTLETSDPDVAHAALMDTYAPRRPIAFSGNFEDFSFHTTSVTAGQVTAATIRHSACTLALAEPFEPFITGVARSGRLNFQTADEDVLVDRDHVARYSTDLPLAVRWDNIDLLVVMVPMTLVGKAADLGLDARHSAFRFLSTAPASPQLNRLWRATLIHVNRELNADGSALGYPLVQAETAMMLAAAALATFPNTTMTQEYLPGPGAVGTAALRRAVAFIDANAHRPITLAEIAASAGVGPRALQLAFRRHRGVTPMSYVRRVRLEAAHRELQAEDPSGASVREIGTRWGFANSDRFVRAYRDVFGVLPDQTLRS